MKMRKHVINALWEKLLKVGTEDRISLFGHAASTQMDVIGLNRMETLLHNY
jgi:hypothetical protein